MGLGHLIDLSRKLQNNKNLLNARKAKRKFIKRSRKINASGKLNPEKLNTVSEDELKEIKRNIKVKIRKEKKREFIITFIKVVILIGIILIFIFLI